MRSIAALLLLCAIPLPLAAQKFNVKVVGRQASDTTYSYQIAGSATSDTASNANCSGDATNYGSGTSVDARCTGTATTNTTYTAPRNISYSVTGATLSLLLPDGRLAIVNCVGKATFGLPVTVPHHRSCRIPITDALEAEFKGNEAKLRWTTSLDDKKFDSETYKILAILPAH